MTDDEDKENALLYFFSSLKYEEGRQNLIMFEPIFEVIKKYIPEGCFYCEFILKRTIVEGYYEGWHRKDFSRSGKIIRIKVD